MKNKRQISKETTRALIINTTKALMIENGVLNTTTKAISNSCKLAHGTIFSHFPNRDNLISTVIKSELIAIAEKIYQIKEQEEGLEVLLHAYLDLVEENEDFMCIINKEFSFLSNDLQREIITTESIVKKLIYAEIEGRVEAGEYKNINVQMLVSFLFGTINYYLSRKTYASEKGSVIREKKKELINTFIQMIKN